MDAVLASSKYSLTKVAFRSSHSFSSGTRERQSTLAVTAFLSVGRSSNLKKNKNIKNKNIIHVLEIIHGTRHVHTRTNA